jgi:hypothetical protein
LSTPGPVEVARALLLVRDLLALSTLIACGNALEIFAQAVTLPMMKKCRGFVLMSINVPGQRCAYR